MYDGQVGSFFPNHYTHLMKFEHVMDVNLQPRVQIL